MKAPPDRPVHVTVYIPSRNYGRFLSDAIESVLRQSLDSWELLLVDDGSADGTGEILARYESDPRVRIFRTGGIGLSGVANLALREARGEYVVRLDADDVLDENALLVLAHHLDRHPEVALVFSDHYLIDEEGAILLHERRHRLFTENHLLDLPPNGAGTMVRRKVLEEIGGYREDLGARDGMDLWTKISRDRKADNVNLPLYFYRRHGQNLTENVSLLLSADRTIKREAIAPLVDAHRPIVAVVPCRRRYDLCPDLWREEVGGRSLLARTLEACAACSLLDEIVVTSDAPEAGEAARAVGDPRIRFVERPVAETQRSRSIVQTLERVARDLVLPPEGTLALSYIQAPFKTTAMLEDAVSNLVLHDVDSAFAVEVMTDPLYRRTPNGLAPINPRRPLSTDFDTIYREAPSVSAVRVRNVLVGSLTGARTAFFPVQRREAFFVDSREDLETARALANLRAP